MNYAELLENIKTLTTRLDNAAKVIAAQRVQIETLCFKVQSLEKAQQRQIAFNSESYDIIDVQGEIGALITRIEVLEKSLILKQIKSGKGQ